MVSDSKRINCQQIFDGLFEAITEEMIELDLVSRMIGLMRELIEVIGSIAGFNFPELQEQLFINDNTMTLLKKMLSEKELTKVTYSINIRNNDYK